MKIKKYIMIFFIILSTLSFAQNIQKENQEEIAKEMQYFNVYDPFEGFNQRMYYFNYKFDKYVFLPVVNTYKFIVPNIMQKGVYNFFDNAQNIKTTTNSLFQGKIKKALRSIGRFSMNIAFGGGGLKDAATDFGMPRPYEDFGLTLAHYGVSNGPYLVLPILGPSNLRDTFGMSFDTIATNKIYLASKIKELNSLPVGVLQAINKRASNNFRYYGTGEAFEYLYVKFLYTKYRKLQEEE